MLVDVDGVLTDRDARPDGAAIGLLVDAVRRGALVALVTGRSKTWLDRQILPHVRSHMADTGPEALRLWLAAEYGAVHAVGLDAPWDHDWRFSVPQDLRAALNDLATAPTRSRFIEWDASKERMATVEACHGASDDHEHRSRTQEMLDAYFDDAQRLAVHRGFNVVRATYAVDVTPPGLTKRVGAEWALQQFASSRACANVVVLGDSGGDVDMARAALDRGIANVTFMWLGESAAPSLHGAALIQPAAPFGAGTQELLSSLLAP
jgi:hypothetical protein